MRLSRATFLTQCFCKVSFLTGHFSETYLTTSVLSVSLWSHYTSASYNIIDYRSWAADNQLQNQTSESIQINHYHTNKQKSNQNNVFIISYMLL